MKQNKQAISDSLARFLADTYATFLKTQNFHWNVTGTDFGQLHLLFEKQYTDLFEAIDEIAERISALGFDVDGSFSSFSQLTKVHEDRGVLTAKEMVEHLISAHEVTLSHGRIVMDLAEREKDGATVDMIGKRLGVHEKFVWMLRSSL